MAFAYAGLLGVFLSVLTRQGSTGSVMLALATGFLAPTLEQRFILAPPWDCRQLGIRSLPWQLCASVGVAFATCAAVGFGRASVRSHAAPEPLAPANG